MVRAWQSGLLITALLTATPVMANPPGATDADTQAWWAATRALSDDTMEGRDTGSAGYDRAAALVAKQFAAAGLKPLGSNGTWFQPIAFDDVRVDPAQSHLTLGTTPLALNRDVLLTPSATMPSHLSVAATFRGLCGPQDLADVAGRMVVCYGRPAPASLNGFDRAGALRAAGAAGMLTIAAPGLPGEPIRWPFAYSRSVTIAGSPATPARPFMTGILNPDSLGQLALDGAHTAHADLGTFNADLTITHATIHSANVLGLLPGTDPALADQVVVVSAHLDGYGTGEPVDGDRIYNGTLDDAAYVALLEQLAARRHGAGFARPVLFAVFTGEEKGLLGSTWFVAHPTLPLTSIMADINLDQVRPLYPLKTLTVHGLNDSALGDIVRAVATARGIGVQIDPEPERHLADRADNAPFVRAGIPATGFVFATYDAVSTARYRDWYQRRYHHPADDLSTPIDWHAARDFNRFFYALTAATANAPARIGWNAGHGPDVR